MSDYDQEQDRPNLPVPYEGPEQSALVPWSQKAVAFQTWDTDLPGGVDKMAKCLRKGDKSLAELLGVVLHVRDIFAHLVEITDDKDGSVTRAMRIVFVLMDGGTVDCVSTGVLKSLGNLIAVYGPPPWPNGFLMRAYETRTRKKFRVICVEPVEGQ
jgi:Phage Single-stranded DNA-binding protein